MSRFFAVVLFVAFAATAPSVSRADDAEKKPAANPPVKALLVTGGCCHDYERQKAILTKGISARANVVWTIAHQGGTKTDSKIPLYEDEDWAKGFDVVVHNECFANVREPRWLDRVLKPHREGTPAVLIHCSMHCYRTGTPDWFEFCGVRSPGHGPHYSFAVENVAPKHPVMAGFGEAWTAPKGELYHSMQVFPTATPLGKAKRKGDDEPQTCVWTNQYGKTRVFATTVGHYNETMADPRYLDMVTRGLLWAVDRLDESEITKPDQETNEAILALATAPVAKSAGKAPVLAGKCCGEGNLAAGRPTKASSEEKGKNNLAPRAVDGNLGTRWCAQGGRSGEWWQVDLGEPKNVANVRIHWESQSANAYQYRVEGSTDGETWKPLVDASENTKKGGLVAHAVEAPETRFLRVTFLGSSGGAWGSFWEFEAYEGDLPALPKSVTNTAKPAATIADVQAPPGFEVRMFGAPPEVNYPVCIAAAPTGEVFVGVDEQGSLGKEKGRGRVLRCLDVDGDGTADEISVFAEMDHPRGLFYDNGSLWVLHPPLLSVFHDDDRDGKADRSETLITGITTDQLSKRGADHTTNGIRMGIDGWIYIAVGDFGFVNAKGADGTTLTKRGGGVLRVRPDGTRMEVYSWGQRNIVDVAVDPYLNVFTRDNTNDGGGWDIRLSHVIQSANYGYPSQYKHFPEEIMPPLKDYGGGSGCGAMYLHDRRWPEGFGDALYTCDWGRSEVYVHSLPEAPPTFEAHQETFLKIPRPTDMDVDGRGLMYVSSWKGGKFNFSGPNVGFVAQIRPIDFVPKPFPNVEKATDAELVEMLKAPSAVWHLHAQRELLRRGFDEEKTKLVAALANDTKAAKVSRNAAIFTLKQIAAEAAEETLLGLVENDPGIREFAMRALTDRADETFGVPTEPFVAALADENPWNRAQALISLGRLQDKRVAEKVLPLTVRSDDSTMPTGDKPHAQPDRGRVIPHLAVKCLVKLNAVEACLKGLEGPYFEGAAAALREMHDPAAVEGLIARLSKESDPARREVLFTSLIRLYHREGEYKGDWWGTRPDTTGPYYDREPWEKSDRIAAVLKTAVADAGPELTEHIRTQLAKHVVKIDGIAALADATPTEKAKPIVVPEVDPNNPKQIANRDVADVYADVLALEGDATRGERLFVQQSCVACHTFKDGQMPKGPHLVDIGKRSKPPELLQSILEPSKKIAQGFDTYTFVTQEGKQVVGFVTGESADTIRVRQTNGLPVELAKEYLDDRVKQELSMMPKGIVGNLTAEELADLLAYLQTLRSGE